jgi:hypothetical protein
MSDIEPNTPTDVKMKVEKPQPEPQLQAASSSVQITPNNRTRVEGFDDDYSVKATAATAEPAVDVLGAKSAQRIPRLLDTGTSIEEKEKPRPRQTANQRAEGEVSLFSLNGNEWEKSSAAYIKGNPD